MAAWNFAVSSYTCCRLPVEILLKILPYSFQASIPTSVCARPQESFDPLSKMSDYYSNKGNKSLPAM